MSRLPTVAILVLNLNGRDHLSICLPGLEAQVYPNRDIVVIDNGSTDGSIEYVRAAHPTVHILELGRNRGFCAAYNEGVRGVATEWVVILNNDTRVAPDWLHELVAAAGRHDASAVGSRILDWDGRRIDFVGGETSFNGHSWQTGHGEPAGEVPDERPLLFACGASMLVNRRVFLDVGGFDEDFFAYFEDVDFGWRLSVLGHRIVLAPRAVTCHRLHGTSGVWAMAPRLRLYERNALAALFKNYEQATLERALPAAVALTLYRALAGTGIDPDAFRLGGRRPPGVVGLPAVSVALLLALEDFGQWLPALAEKRAAIQSRRRRSDRELFPLFGDPFKLHEVDERYVEAARALVDDFGLDAIFRRVGGSKDPFLRTTETGGSEDPPLRTAETGGAEDPPLRTTGTGGSEDPSLRATETGGSEDPPLRSVVVEAGLQTRLPLEIGPELPAISVIIPTILGDVHLPACLDALRAQEYPADRVEVIVVDNGARSDLASLVRRHHPRAGVVRPGRNLGFAPANNLGASHAQGMFLAFLNDDTSADPRWLRAMVDVAARRRAACVAAYVVDWEGRVVDFAGGLVNFEGKGMQEYTTNAVSEIDPAERPILFANGAAMLVHREVFQAVGRWDESTFAYYEDVELGWRLWMLGHDVWFTPEAVVHHRHHGTSGRWPEPPRVRLLERNALRTIYALLETEQLSGALTASLLLAADRALLQTPFHRGVSDEAVPAPPPRPSVGERARQELRLRGARRNLPLVDNLRRIGPRGLAGAAVDTLVPQLRRSAVPPSRRAYLIEEERQGRAFDGRREALPADAAARLLGVQDFLRDLPALSIRRRDLQARRRRSDAEIFGRFGDRWLAPVPAANQALHNELHARLVRVLKIDRFGERSPAGGAKERRV